MQVLFRAIPKTLRANHLLAWHSSFPKPFCTTVCTYIRREGAPPRKQGSPLKIGPLTPEQHKTCYELGAQAGWYIFKGDTEAFFETEQKGFFGGEINGEFVCGYTGVKYEDYFFLSLHVTKDEYQGLGYGTEIENYAKDFYKDAVSVCFEASGERIQRFVKMGCKEHTAATVVSKKAEGKMDKSLIDLRSVPIEELEAYDLSVFGYKRPNYLRALLNQPSNRGLAARKDGKLCGFAILREQLYQRAYGITPFMADDKETGFKILDGLQSYIPGEEVSLAIFLKNPIGLEIIKRGNWTVVDEYLRMYSGQKPKIDLNRLIIDDTY